MPVTSFANTDETQVPNLTTLVSSLMNWAPPLRTYWKVVRMDEANTNGLSSIIIGYFYSQASIAIMARAQ